MKKTFGQKQHKLMNFNKDMKYQDIIAQAEKLQAQYNEHSLIIDFVKGEFLLEGKKEVDTQKMDDKEIIHTEYIDRIEMDFSSWKKDKTIKSSDYKKNLIEKLKKASLIYSSIKAGV